MKEIIKTALSLFGKLIIVNFMCAVVVLSVSVIANGLFADSIGYTALGTKEGSEESETLYTYYYADGEDTLREKYEKEGYTVVEYSLRELSTKGNIIATCVTQALCLMLLSSFIYPLLWQLGTKDSNLVKFKHKKADTLKGLKIGLLTIIPALALLIFLLVTKNSLVSQVPLAIYKLINSSLYGFIDLADGSASFFADLSVMNFIFLLVVQLIIPVIAYVSYILGFKNISIGEKIVYKRNKK